MLVMIFAQFTSVIIDDHCPAKLYYECEFIKSPESKRLYDKYKETFDYLRMHTGEYFSRNNVAKSLNNLRIIYNALLIQVSANTKYTKTFLSQDQQEIHVSCSASLLVSVILTLINRETSHTAQAQ